MAKHKAATEVTVAPLTEKTGFELFISKYWLHFTAVALLITAWVLFDKYSGMQAEAARDGSWATLNSRTTPGMFTQVPTGSAETFGQLASELQGSAAGPWARVLEINAMLADRHYAEAAQAVDQLEKENPNHPLVTETLDFGDGRPPRTAVQNLAETIDRQRAWEAAHGELFANPAPPEGSPRVRLVTTKGDIVVALYEEAAPKHVEAFLSHCKEGFYDGTKFHAILRNSRILGGDPNSREGDPSTWGMGGPKEGPAFEDSHLYHFAGVLASVVEPGQHSSHGSQFMITLNPAHELDGSSVVFGSVVEGMDVVSQVGAGTTDPTAATRPTAPVTISSTEIL